MVNYKTIYSLPFQSRKGVDYLIEIQKEGYDGTAFELTGSGESPFSVEIDSEDFLYTPTRFSTGTIRIVGSDYLQQLYSTAYQQHRVLLKRNDNIAWCGFVRPELYTQDYSSDLFELEIECISAMSVLEFINYKQETEGSKAFVSLFDLLKKCIVSSRGQYSAVYMPHVYAKNLEDYTLRANVLLDMTISEQDFFDEDDKPMKLKEVLSEVCRFLNWTCVDHLGALYFIDVDHNGEYYCYDASLTKFSIVDFESILSVQNIGFAGSGHTLDRLNGYNKCSVRTSNYPVGEVFPAEDFDSLKIINKYKKTNSPSNPNWPDRTETSYGFLSPSAYTTYHYFYNEYDMPEFEIVKGWQEMSEKWFEDLDVEMKFDQIGASILKRCEIKFNNGVPESVNYDFEDIIWLAVANTKYYPISTVTTILPIGKPVLSIGGHLPCAAYQDGAISINMSIQTDGMARQNPGTDKEFNFQPIRMYFKLKIGNRYYNGEGWTDNESTFSIEFENKGRAYEKYGFINVKNTKTLDMPYNGTEGYIIPIDRMLAGFPSLEIVGFFAKGSGVYDDPTHQYGCFVKDLKVVYHKKDGDIWKTDNNADRYYENEINEDYINELDEIEFKISSYNNDGACYSKVLLGNEYLTDNLYSAIVSKPIRPEEHLIQRIVNRYGATNIKLTQVIRESPDLTPISRISDKHMGGKVFINTGGFIDYNMDSFQCVMIQV